MATFYIGDLLMTQDLSGSAVRLGELKAVSRSAAREKWANARNVLGSR
jgi:hypothetical protein